MLFFWAKLSQFDALYDCYRGDIEDVVISGGLMTLGDEFGHQMMI